MQKNLNQKLSQATKWSSITEVAVKLIAPITNAILARLLVPEAFGVVATLTMVVSFAEIFTDAGFQMYLVQHEFQDENDLDVSTNAAFWTNLALSILLWAGIACFATPIANMVGSSGSELAIIVMCFQIPLLAFSSIQQARYRRDFDFKTLFAVRVTTALVPLMVTVPLAVIFRNYWALVIGTLARDLINAIILTVKSKWKPKFEYNFLKVKEMISFSLWTVIENIAIWLTAYSGTFIVGNVLNAYYLGLYKTAISTTESYLGIITLATMPVMFSGLSRCQNNDREFREVFLRFQRMVSVLLFPLGCGLYVYRELATRILLGEQWLEAANFMGMWSLANVTTIVFARYNSDVFRSKGKPNLSLLTQVLHLAALVPVQLWSAGKGFEFLTIAVSLARLEMILVSGIVLQKTIGIRFVSALKNVWPSMVSAGVMLLVGMVIRTAFDSVIWELLTVFICVIVYVVAMLVIPGGRRQLAEVPILRKLFRIETICDIQEEHRL